MARSRVSNFCLIFMFLNLMIFDYNQHIYVIISGFVKKDSLVWLILYIRLVTFTILEKLFKFKPFRHMECTNTTYILICIFALILNIVIQYIATCKIFIVFYSFNMNFEIFTIKLSIWVFIPQLANSLKIFSYLL